MRIAFVVLSLVSQLLMAPPARAMRSVTQPRTIADALSSTASDCRLGQALRNGSCVNLPVGAPAPSCPSRVADGSGGCAPAQAVSSPTQSSVATNVRPHTSIQLLGGMQVPWSVSIQPATNYVAIGQCLAVYIDLFDAAAKDIPRNPIGQRVTLADFDWSATGNAAVGKYSGPNAWAVCACPAAAMGSTIHVMATYPSASMPEKSKVPGLAFQSYIDLPVTKAPGTNSPAGCDNVLVTTTVATSVPGGAQPPSVLPPHGQPPAANPATTAPATPPQAASQGPYQATPLPLPPVQLAPPQTTTPPSSQPSQPSPPSGTAYPPPGAAPATAPPAPTQVAAPVAASARYRVVATGFRVLHQTKDDVLSRDGHGDEIYGAAIVLHYDRRTSQLIESPSMRRTQVIGEAPFEGQTVGNFTDINGVIPWGRIRGGTASAGGGFAQNDVFPAVADPSNTYGAAATDNTFPFLIADNVLTDGQDAIVIVPTLWEADGYRDGFVKWTGYESRNAIQIWSDQGVQAAVSGTQLAVISPSGTLETSFGPHFTAGNVFGSALAESFGPLNLLLAGSYDRPIGAGMHGASGLSGLTAGPVLPRRAIVITREIIEATLAKQATYNPSAVGPVTFAVWGAPPVSLSPPPPGTLAVQLFESPADDLQGMYILYIKVERVP